MFSYRTVLRFNFFGKWGHTTFPQFLHLRVRPIHCNYRFHMQTLNHWPNRKLHERVGQDSIICLYEASSPLFLFSMFSLIKSE